MSDDDENKSDSDSSSSSSDDRSSSDSSSSSIEGSEPPPAGDETEPAPQGESSEADEKPDQPLEDVEGHSDSSAETDGSSSGGSSSASSSDGSSSSEASGSSDDSSGGKSVQPPSNDDVASCIMHACNAHDVPIDDDTVNVTSDGGPFYRFFIRLGRNFDPLPKVHDDTQSLQTGSVQGALYALQGSVQIIETSVRITARVVSIETSEIFQASLADGSSSSSIEDAITGAMGDALAGLSVLSAT